MDGLFDAIGLLSYTEMPGVYVRPDTGFVFVFDHVTTRIKERDARAADACRSTNPTRSEATVRVLSEIGGGAAEPLRPGAVLDAQTAVVPAGATIQLSVPPLRAALLPDARLTSPLLRSPVSEAAPLLALLRRIRRRLRLWKAVEGPVVGSGHGRRRAGGRGRGRASWVGWRSAMTRVGSRCCSRASRSARW